MKCQLLMTGNELMTGVTVDTNATWMADKLLSIGIGVEKKVTVGDRLSQLEKEIQEAAGECDLLIINGGLGPTVDDLTAQALAAACHSPLVVHSVATTHIHHWCEQRGIIANAANLKQAALPAAADIIPNKLGSAVGIRIEHKGCLILCTPGVPIEMRTMFDQEILPLLLLRSRGEERPYICRLQTFGMGESTIQQKILNEYPQWPSEIELGFRAGFPTLEVKLTVHKKEHLPLRDIWEQKLRALLGSVIFGQEHESLPMVVINLLREHKAKLVTAESCTGGLIASMITAIPGASHAYEAGFVTYSNTVKHHVLGVDQKVLDEHGAVSEAVVIQMAKGALQKSGADYVIAVSGIAGPEGGSEEKPVGTTWVAWGKKDQLKSEKFFYPGERKMFQMIVAAYGLDLTRRELLGITEKPRYFRQANH